MGWLAGYACNKASVASGGQGGGGDSGGHGGGGESGEGGREGINLSVDSTPRLDADPRIAPPTLDANCGSQTSTSQEPVDVLLLLDRSGSMSESIADDCCCATVCSLRPCEETVSCTERWPALTSAVSTTVVGATGINWGLKFFASPPAEGQIQKDNCTVSPGVEAPIGSSASTIQARISGVSLGNNTPTAKAITAATAYLQTVNDQHQKFILLATDGQPNCGATGLDADLTGARAALQSALTAGIKVYVIGIGPSVGNLDDLAQAGGTDHYYPATSPADLSRALESISKAVLSCTFTIEDPPEGSDASNLAVYTDGALVAKDPSDGWSLGPTPRTVQLNGFTCGRVTSGNVHKVQVLLGCETPPQILF